MNRVSFNEMSKEDFAAMARASARLVMEKKMNDLQSSPFFLTADK